MDYQQITEGMQVWVAFNVAVTGFMFVVLLFSNKVSYNVYCMFRERK